MNLFKKKKKGFGLSKKKSKKLSPNTPSSSANLDDSLKKVDAPLQGDDAVPESTSVSLDDLQKVNIKKRTRIKKRKKRSNINKKPSFFDKLSFGKKKLPSQAPVMPKPAEDLEPQTGDLPTKELKRKGKTKVKVKKRKVKRQTAKKKQKTLKLLLGLLFAILGLLVALFLLLDDTQDSSLQGTVTDGNIETQQVTDNQVTLEVAEENTQEEPSQPTSEPVENKEQAVPAEEVAESVENKEKTTDEQSQQPSEQFIDVTPNNSNPQITLTDKDFVELSDTIIYREE